MKPYDEPWWFYARLKELLWTSLGTVQAAFWLVIGAVLWLALKTDRNPQAVAVISALMPLAGILAGAYTARRLGDNVVQARYASNGTSAPLEMDTPIFSPGADDPTA